MYEDKKLKEKIYKCATLLGAKYGLNHGNALTQQDINRLINVEAILEDVKLFVKNNEAAYKTARDLINKLGNKSAQHKNGTTGLQYGGAVGAAVGAYKTYKEAEKTWRWANYAWNGFKNAASLGGIGGILAGAGGLFGTQFINWYTSAEYDVSSIDEIEDRNIESHTYELVKQAMHKHKLIAELGIVPEEVDPDFPGRDDLSKLKRRFKCPISSTTMIDPVLAPDGQTYEREELLKWYNQGKRTCPLNRNRELSHPDTWVQNHAVRSMIIEYKEYKASLKPEESNNNDFPKMGRSSTSSFKDLVNNQNSGVGPSSHR
jgi:hypothetical protein